VSAARTTPPPTVSCCRVSHRDPGDPGTTNDLFFLSFDQLGSHAHAYVEPTVTVSPPAPDDVTKQPDFGVATFERINSSMARITGVPITNGVVSTLYHSEQQSLPAGSLISAFLPFTPDRDRAAGDAYCGQLIGTQSLRDAFFGAGWMQHHAGARGFFGASGSATAASSSMRWSTMRWGRTLRAAAGACAARSMRCDARSHAQVRRHRRHRHHGGLRRGARQRGRDPAVTSGPGDRQMLIRKKPPRSHALGEPLLHRTIRCR